MTDQNQLKLDRLISKKENIFRRVQNCYDAGLALEGDPQNQTKLRYFSVRYSTWMKTVEEYETIVQRIVEQKQIINPDLPVDYNLLDAFHELYSYIEYFASKFLKPDVDLNRTTKTSSHLSLPKIDLVKFDGEDLTIWPIFSENFKYFVHNKTDLGKPEKLQYLLGSITGKALRSCSSIEPIPANYDILWKLLEDTYDNKKYLFGVYMDKILNFRPIACESPTNLNLFLENFDTNVSALKRLKLTNLEEYILTYIALSKLPQETISNFDLIRNSDQIATYDEILKFLRQRSKNITTFNKPKPFNSSKPLVNSPSKPMKSFHITPKQNDNFCLFCSKGRHLLKDCSAFTNSSFENRFKLIKDKNLCLNCFSAKHKVNFCPSKYSCLKCRARHHTLLHKENPIEDLNPPINVDSYHSQSPSSSKQLEQLEPIKDGKIYHVQVDNNCDMKSKGSVVALLSTIVVKVNDKWNREKYVRFLLDSGSMSNLITLECVRKLGICYSKLNLNIVGIGGAEQPLKGKTVLSVISKYNQNVKFPIEALIVENITSSLPDTPIDRNCLNSFANIPLADPNFYTPNRIDGILGASVFAQILGSKKIVSPVGYPTAIETSLGYVIMGQANVANFPEQIPRVFFNINTELDSLVEKMWEIEDFSSPVMTNEDDICENIFCKKFSRQPDGRYLVPLPFKEEPSVLGESFTLAKNRLLTLEKRLEKYPELRLNYSNILKDYIDQGHMSLVNDTFIDPSFYIPHHCVFKLASFSTPCRVVFDASMKTDTGKSLNDILYKGPKLQNNLVSVLLNFRLYSCAITADIKQMYRQILIIEEHRKFLKILWRSHPDSPILTYQLNTVPFGVKSSPYLSLRVLKQLCQDESKTFSDIVEHISRDMYIDDYLSSFPTCEEAITTHFRVINLLHRGGFKLAKFMSNSEEFLNSFPNDLKLCTSRDFDSSYFKVLGLQWYAKFDIFNFQVQPPPDLCTKRTVLSVLARIFDPLGFLSPFTLSLKLLIKNLWQLNYDWDQSVTGKVLKQWKKIKNEFHLLNNVSIPRHIGVFSDSSLGLVGFADASGAAYAAVVYSRVIDMNGEVKVTLLISQTKVAPTSNITLPRLELCAAVLLARLISNLVQIYSPRHPISQIFAFTDSMITLNWIKSPPKKLPSFVSNRILKIQNTLPSSYWFFVPGKENVADCASRGLDPSTLVNHNTWHSGPKWLAENPCDWPVQSIENDISLDSCQVEQSLENFVFVVTAPISPLYSLITRLSSWTKLLRATVYVLRFCKILPLERSISVSELEKAEMVLIIAVQQRHFFNEFRSISKGLVLKPPIRRLNPFVQDNIIRVGGRLSLSDSLSYDHKHPILLPKSDIFTSLLIDYFHKRYLHTGSHLLHSLLRQRYWILSARDIIRQRVWKCNLCFRLNPKPQFPIMADLPVERITQAKAFFHTGVDYTGAFSISMGRYRGVKTQKAYICLFVCLCTKALHLELVSSLTTSACVDAFKRFISRRGTCSIIFSDRGTNFVGAKRYFDELSSLVDSQEYNELIQKELSLFNVTWKFNAPTASWFGGLWESNVRSVKVHLSRVIGSQILTYEEFTTVLTQIECLLNSRPICVLDNNPNNPIALTPTHFLFGSPLNSLPSSNMSILAMNQVDRFKLCDAMVQHFWKRWHVEYLSTLQSRQKWNTPLNPGRIGMLVVIMNENLPPLQWPLGIVEKLFPGKDGISRVAEVRTKNGLYVRPMAKLCPLPNQ